MGCEVRTSREIWHRDDFALLCDWRRLTRVVEVGVDRGEFANTFLSRSIQCDLYVGVDNWLPYGEMDLDRDGDYFAAKVRFERHARRAKLVRGNSVDVARTLMSRGSDHFLYRPYDFAYVDGAHDRESVLADLVAWWPVLRDGGVMAGHDFSAMDGSNAGVREAVEEFFGSMGVTVWVTQDDPSSWYTYKGGEPGPDWARVPGGEEH